MAKRIRALTDITIILDRSGSMTSCREEAENGVNRFIKEQRDAGECNLTFIQFDDKYEVIHQGDIKSMPKFKLKPRGMTALLDAVGKGISAAVDRTDGLAKKPAAMVFLIVTDGAENSSHEYKLDVIKGLIEEKQKSGWMFTFLGANQDAFKAGGAMGIAHGATANFVGGQSVQAFAGASAAVTRGVGGQSVGIQYTDQEREDMT